MQTLETLRRKIASASDLLSVVKTMKVLAAVSVRQYERAVQSLVEYNRTVEMGLQIVLQAEPHRLASVQLSQHRRLGAIVFGSDQGLAGQFNERIVAYGIDKINGMQIKHDDRAVVAVGERCTGLLDEARQPVEAHYAAPSGLSGVTPLVQDLLLHIDKWRWQDEIDQVVLLHHQPLSGASYQPRLVRLLPIDLAWLHDLAGRSWSSRVLPTYTLEWDRLFAALIRETMFVALYRACAESVASEEASRLAAMQNAERNIEERLQELNTHFHHQRQNSITAELLDIVAGYEVVMGDGL